MRCIIAVACCLAVATLSARAESYAVLPFSNASGDQNLDWIGESIAETLNQALSAEGFMIVDRDDRVEVYHRLSVRPYAVLTKASVLKLGETMDAGQVIYGQFEVKPANDPALKSRGTLQIRGRVLDLHHMKEGPEFREFGALEDLAALENHLAWQAVRFLNPDRAPSEAAFRERHPPVRVDAVENYVRGLLASNPDEKHRLFSQAVHLDPALTQAALQLGYLDWKKKDYKSAAEWFRKVRPSDVHSHEANFFLGLCLYYAGDFEGAQRAFQTVAAAVPLNEVLNNLGATQLRRNAPEALDSLRKAMDGDPNDPTYQFNVAYALWRQGRFQEAAAKFRAVLDRNPDDTTASMLLARCMSQSGPRPSDTHTEGLERLKTNFEENQYLQLKALLQPEKP